MQKEEVASRGSLRAAGRADGTERCFIHLCVYEAELGAGLKMLKVDLVVVCVKTCCILLFPKALLLMSFLEELSCAPTKLLLPSCPSSPHGPEYIILPKMLRAPHFYSSGTGLWLRSLFQSWTASFQAHSRCLVGASTSDLPWSAAKDKPTQNRGPHHHPSACFQNHQGSLVKERDIFGACFNSAGEMMMDPL